MPELQLPPSVERRKKLDISLGYCLDLDPRHLLTLGVPVEVRVDDPAQLVDFLLHDSTEDTLYHVNHLRSGQEEWELACFARHGEWTFFCSVYSTALAANPRFGDDRRRRLACGGSRIIDTRSLELAAHRPMEDRADELTAALEMDLFLSRAMAGKNLSNGFNVGGSKSVVHVGRRDDAYRVEPEEVREFARFMARCHNTITQGLPVFIGTGSDIGFHEHGDAYYDLCSRLSPNYFGNAVSARRWGRVTAGNTTAPTTAGVLACLEAVTQHLGIAGDDRSILVKGLGGIGAAVARSHAARGWNVYASEMRQDAIDAVRREMGDRVRIVDEEEWGSLPRVSLFSPNAAGSSVTRENLPVLQKLGVRAVVGGENNIVARDVDPEEPWRRGILTFADFLVNGGGAWIAAAEMVERPVEDVHEWIRTYQVPTLLLTAQLAKEEGRSPATIFTEFIASKVRELLA